jgi:uncharacterized protein with ParB-like and HNH nuclease domain
MSIASLLNQVKEKEIVLPAIQRNFVWPIERIYTLLDSIMRGYPIGNIVLWETHNDIQHRFFIADYQGDSVDTYHDNPSGKRLKLVIDGQQRLQSLYVAIYGTYDSNPLFFDVLSGREKDDVSEDKYIFLFYTQQRFKELNENVLKQLTVDPEKREKSLQPSYYIKVSDLFSMTVEVKEHLKEKLTESLSLAAADRIRLSVNLSLLDQSLSKEGDLLRETVIDNNLPANSKSRKSDHDVLEIFVRVNTLNTRLSRSDLIFSMLKLNWKESATYLPEFIREINEGNSFELNNDFVIRCLFAVSNLGTKFDIDLLRKKMNVIKLRDNFNQCCDAIRSTVDFIQDKCWCANSGILGGSNTLVPLVYYLFNTNKHQVPNNQISRVRKAMYLFGFTKPFSRYGDSRVWAFIRDELKPLIDNNDETFPLDSTWWWIDYWEKVRSFDDLLQSNHILTLHLIQGLTGAAFKYEGNAPEVDHIFPRSILREKGFEPSQVNNFANFWILAKTKNRNKSNQHPAEYFTDVDDKELKMALIEREYLDYRRYTTFLEHRAQLIIKKAQEKLGFSGDEFEKESKEE